jgi:glycosyltransferase involved in cell wall biosynthesis
MTTGPRVSIAMATYNGERFIREQLDSFAAQTLLPDELVVCDDGSTDSTMKIVEEFAATVPFSVKIYRNAERLDFSRNFEKALSFCTGEIVFFSDQDDVWFPEKIEVVIAQFDRDPAIQVVANDQLLTDAELNHSSVTKLDNLRRAGKNSDGLLEGCCTAFRRSWGDRLLPIPPHLFELVSSRGLSHDGWLNELSIFLSVRFVVDQPLQYFRRTGENVTDWLLSRPKPVRISDRVALRTRHVPLDAWMRRIGILNAYEDFLATCSKHPESDVEQALMRLRGERSSIAARAKVTEMSLPRRASAVWYLWRSGGYRYFQGWLSAVNDLLRSA